MCLAIPGKLIKKDGNRGIIGFEGMEREVYIHFIPEVKEGEYVLVHAGCAIEIIDEEEARKTIELLMEFKNYEIY